MGLATRNLPSVRTRGNFEVAAVPDARCPDRQVGNLERDRPRHCLRRYSDEALLPGARGFASGEDGRRRVLSGCGGERARGFSAPKRKSERVS